METPIFWKGSLEDIEASMKMVQRGKAEVLCHSAGGRNIYLVEYGKRNYLHHYANYSSATGAGDPKHYANKTEAGYMPTVLLVGATHGGEFEGTVAILNLISLLETGKDFCGREKPEVLDEVENINLLLIPCLNVDGRARVPFESFLGKDYETFRYYSQGTWKDGTLCEWPDCKAKHPMKEHAGFLGSYFNDDGVNLMHDKFFFPMAEETKALLQLCDERVPDITILLHGGSNTRPCILQTNYVPEYMNHQIYDYSLQVKRAADAKGYVDMFRVCEKEPRRSSYPPSSFNLPSACSHINGEICMTFESNQGLATGNQHTPEQIYEMHLILLTEAFRFAKQRKG